MSQLRPLLKWAGGKRQLLPELRRFYPAQFARYVEPFFGSGAVFFDLHASGRLDGHRALLIDSNPDLIGCYTAVRDAPEAVADALDRLAAGHARDPRAHYFTVRDAMFNPERERRRAADRRLVYTAELAAMFIYLNRTGFNGLYRVNARGAFNVPPGRYERPRIADREKLTRVAAALSSPGVELRCDTFASTRAFARAGDFVYFDPPYAPLTATANFTAYTAGGFDARDQQTLQQLVIELARRGCHVVVSNSTAEEVTALYGPGNVEARRAGLRTHRVPARRAINSKPSARGPVYEYVIVADNSIG